MPGLSHFALNSESFAYQGIRPFAGRCYFAVGASHAATFVSDERDDTHGWFTPPLGIAVLYCVIKRLILKCDSHKLRAIFHKTA